MTDNRSNWSKQEESKLKDLLRQSASLNEQYAAFPYRSTNSVRTKGHKLRQRDPTLGSAPTTRAIWSLEEDRILNSKFEEDLNFSEIKKFLPQRTLKSIPMRLYPRLVQQTQLKNRGTSLAQIKRRGYCYY